MQARGFILQPTYRVRHGRPVIQLYGRLESGEAFLVEDDRFRPYFFALKTDANALAGVSDIEIEETGLRDFRGREVIRINASIPAAVPPLRDRLHASGLPCFESDIRFPYRYLIDWGIRASVEIDGPAEVVRAGFVRFHNPSLAACSWRPSLRQLSLDLETTRDASRIFSAALATDDGVEEVHLVHRSAVAGAISHSDESQLLAAVSQRIRELDPDIITGWNVVDFDLRTWLKRCEALGVPGRIGRAGGGVTFQQDARFARQSRAEVPGRVVLDGIPLVRDAIRLADYRLETVARALLGRGKLIDADAHDPVEEIQRLYREEPEKLAAYNLEDARLVLEILEHEGLVDLAIERSLLCGMQLDRVGASIASFDLVYLPELRRRGVVAPSVDASRKTAVVRGGALLEPVPGLFRNVAVYDFKSLYPSLIRTFNLDPLAHARALHGESGAPQTLDAPNGARFSRAEAILPSVIERFMERREAAKQRGDRYADQAIKIMMNAMFGVLGAASCRFFDPGIANAITGFGQQTLHWTRDALRAEGVEVLYGDTDSVFVQLRSRNSRARAEAEAEALRSRVEEQISGRIREQYRVEPKLLLELERVFDRLFLPKVRGGSSGSKKRYAGSVDGRLEIVGLEAVRRDWPAIAGRLQRGLLERLFSDRDVMPFAIDLVASVRAGECDDELVYAKRVRKASVESYTASTPPHIQAARKAGGAAGPVIRYLITQQGPEPVLPGRPLPEHIDRRHYLDRVLRPIADGILSQVGHDFDEVLGEPHQLDLL